MIDVWLITSLLVPLAEVLLHTFMENMRAKVEKAEERRLSQSGDSRSSRSSSIDK